MRYLVKLTPAQRFSLIGLVNKGQDKARKLTHARILLQADSGKEGPALKAKVIADGLNVHERTVHRVRQQFAAEGLSAALNRKEHRGFKPRRLDGAQEAKLIAMCCGPKPEGRTSWTLDLLADSMVKLTFVDSVSRSTIYRTLKKMHLNPG